MTQKTKAADSLHSLSHTKWNCRYHIVFAPKCRRMVFYEGRRLEIGKILSDLCRWKNVVLVEGEACPNHILAEIPPKMSVSGFMGFLKGKSSQMIYEKRGDAKFKFRSREFWCRGYYVDTVGKNSKKIQEYIRTSWRRTRSRNSWNLNFAIPSPGRRTDRARRRPRQR